METEREGIDEERFLALLQDGATLANLELEDADLSATQAEQLHLRNCRFVDTVFAHADWEGLVATGCSFVRCQFLATKLPGASFTRCDFFDAQSSKGCSFAGARLRI